MNILLILLELKIKTWHMNYFRLDSEESDFVNLSKVFLTIVNLSKRFIRSKNLQGINPLIKKLIIAR